MMTGVYEGGEYTPLAASDLSAWLGEPINEDEDVARAEMVLRYAWTLVNTETGRDMHHWQLKGLPQAVELVVLAVAARGYTNPDSWANERVDDWGAGGRPIEQLGMYLTAAEQGVLARFGERVLRGLGSIRTYQGHSHSPHRDVVPTPDGPGIIWYG